LGFEGGVRGVPGISEIVLSEAVLVCEIVIEVFEIAASITSTSTRTSTTKRTGGQSPLRL